MRTQSAQPRRRFDRWVIMMLAVSVLACVCTGVLLTKDLLPARGLHGASATLLLLLVTVHVTQARRTGSRSLQNAPISSTTDDANQARAEASRETAS